MDNIIAEGYPVSQLLSQAIPLFYPFFILPNLLYNATPFLCNDLHSVTAFEGINGVVFVNNNNFVLFVNYTKGKRFFRMIPTSSQGIVCSSKTGNTKLNLASISVRLQVAWLISSDQYVREREICLCCSTSHWFWWLGLIFK